MSSIHSSFYLLPHCLFSTQQCGSYLYTIRSWMLFIVNSNVIPAPIVRDLVNLPAYIRHHNSAPLRSPSVCLYARDDDAIAHTLSDTYGIRSVSPIAPP
jgi:hypothetical protein